MAIAARRVHILGVTAHPDRGWAGPQARHLVTDLAERTGSVRFFIRGRDAKVTAASGDVVASEAARVVTAPPRAPRADCHAERWVRTARAERTDRMLICHQAHLRAVMWAYARHYHDHRPHQSRNQRPPAQSAPVVVCRPRRRCAATGCPAA